MNRFKKIIPLLFIALLSLVMIRWRMNSTGEFFLRGELPQSVSPDKRFRAVAAEFGYRKFFGGTEFYNRYVVYSEAANSQKPLYTVRVECEDAPSGVDLMIASPIEVVWSADSTKATFRNGQTDIVVKLEQDGSAPSGTGQ